MAISWLRNVWVLCFIISMEIPVFHGKITCRNNDGNPVDWYMIYKLPKIYDNQNKPISQGLDFYYMDVDNQKWTLSDQNINSTKQAVYYTLNQIYSNHKAEDVMYIIYNDETPEKIEKMEHGHTKGDVAFDKAGGFWLVHSVPRFPPRSNSSYSYPETGTHYGQTFLCMTLPYAALNTIGVQLLYNYPQIYDSNLPPDISADAPAIGQVLSHKQKHVTVGPWSNVVTLTTTAGQQFDSFAKYKDFEADLYHDLVAPYYQSPLFTETWQNGRGSLSSNCTKPQVENIKEVIVGKTSFKSTKDHSKWAVTTQGYHTCVGDINRQISQELRPGGTVCVDLHQVWSAFNSSIGVVDSC